MSHLQSALDALQFTSHADVLTHFLFCRGICSGILRCRGLLIGYRIVGLWDVPCTVRSLREEMHTSRLLSEFET